MQGVIGLALRTTGIGGIGRISKEMNIPVCSIGASPAFQISMKKFS